ncbi:hypothetical protein MCOR02_011365 [Pyricularia oryzae]|uniref:Uncharacterized protein n=2 Tax=Pyricularia oryzae TaxID=318829 RepID=G4N3F1_PYRO7|nr:uncharacterized protein MGG_13463 [Pyricularia oryzae 70-15]KAH9427866.1 hypothetical protein MCOR02_011365 [Pyricularia oryzae]EHA51829.1 hypothetical protein MGG_13463 [Pyricularia oryzae 70-15]KAI6309670.1 hypothetical protein MCOR34_006685 [Pyricularia oryzae]KAI6399840.1 hypothetical protein MCOR23_005055 [Pyricularia oryzae]KAI6415227.1 hypothetical protein MCOR20_001713 [Pyricularia oryzae]
MCGHDTSGKPRGGAIAVLNSSMTSPQTCGWCAELTFHTPGRPGSPLATHARLTSVGGEDLTDFTKTSVLIHESGDFTRCAEDCGLFRSFDFQSAVLVDGGLALEMELPHPMEIQVGDNGIIGRRVSMRRTSGDASMSSRELPTAEGIVGFNFLAKA